MTEEITLGEIQDHISRLDKNLEQQRKDMDYWFDQLLDSYYSNRPPLIMVDELQLSLEILEAWLQDHSTDEEFNGR